MDFLITPTSTSPPESSTPLSTSSTRKSDNSSTVPFEKILEAHKTEAKETEEKAATAAAAAAVATQPAAQQNQLQVLSGNDNSQSSIQAGTVTSTTSEQAQASTITATTSGQVQDNPAAAQAQTSTLTTEAAPTLTGEQAASLVTATELPGFAETLQTGLASTDPIGPEDQPKEKTGLADKAADATAAAVTFTEGTGTDGLKLGAVTTETSQASPATALEPAPKEAAAKNVQVTTPGESAPVEDKTAAPKTATVEPAKNAAIKVESEPASKARTSEKSQSQETTQANNNVSKPEVTTNGVNLEPARQTLTSQAPALKQVESQAAALAQQIREGMEAATRQGRTTLRLQLSPQDLGAINIRLVSSVHGVSLTVIADQDSTGRLLESQINQLRQNLADSGVQLSNLNINQHNQSGQTSQGFGHQANPQQYANRFRGQLSQENDNGLSLPAQVIKNERGVDYRV
jgi:flagellar hook-length control protein FliK